MASQLESTLLSRPQMLSWVVRTLEVSKNLHLFYHTSWPEDGRTGGHSVREYHGACDIELQIGTPAEGLQSWPQCLQPIVGGRAGCRSKQMRCMSLSSLIQWVIGCIRSGLCMSLARKSKLYIIHKEPVHCLKIISQLALLNDLIQNVDVLHIST